MHALEKLGLPKKLKKFDINDEYNRLISEREIRKDLMAINNRPKLKVVREATEV